MCISRRGVRAVCLTLGCLLGSVACNDLSGLAGSQSLPTGTPDPNSLRTPAGATQLYNAVVSAFGGAGTGVYQNALLLDVWTSGLLTDEFTTGVQPPDISAWDATDARQLSVSPGDPGSVLYQSFQGIRGGVSEAIGALAAYDDSAVALRGHLYALRGYADIFLADMFCSGVPLSTLDFNGNYTYHGPSTTTQVYQAAIANFDTALALSTDSVRFLNLARVGRGRAYLALGRYDSAAAAVGSVPNTFVYSVPVNWSVQVDVKIIINENLLLANREGENGLPYLSNGDPRDSVQFVGSTSPISGGVKYPVYWPLKYGGANLGTTQLVVADGIEAQLIRAEAAFHTDSGAGDWLAQLNALRHEYALTAGLPDLANPATPDSQVNLIFQERAYWLYITGHRQGDLRRLIRNYGRDPDSVYPTGPYQSGLLPALPIYGTDVDLQIPATEAANPLFQGCLARGA